MPSLYRRGSKWWVKYYLHGKPIYESLHTTNERVAHKKVVQIEYRLTTGGLVQPSKTPLAQFLEDYCAYLKTTHTRKSYKNDVSYLRTVFGPVTKALVPGTTCNKSKTPAARRPRKMHKQANARRTSQVAKIKALVLEDVAAAEISRFITQRVQHDGISPKTANRTREVLHRMFNYAIKECGCTGSDGASQNPVSRIDRRRESAPDIRFLDAEQMERQLDAMDEHPALQAMVGTLIYAGLRREELLWLTREDVDVERRLLRIRAKTIDGVAWQPKTKRNRVVPISRTLLSIINAYDLGLKKERAFWFFPSPTGKCWDPDNFSRAIRKINRKHKLPWSCLDYRHTFGSRLAQKGESLFKIAELMGNSPDICRRHYAALIPEQMHDVVEFDAPRTSDEPSDPMPQADANGTAFRADGTDGAIKHADGPQLRLVR